jgi:hypothetical protein
METTLGSIGLAIPKLRKDSYFPSFLTPRRRWETAFVNVVATAYVEGVSTRAMDNLVVSQNSIAPIHGPGSDDDAKSRKRGWRTSASLTWRPQHMTERL